MRSVTATSKQQELNVVYNEEEEYVQIKEENKEKREVGSSVGKIN